MDVLHADILHHRCFLINVWSHDTERRAALFDHACTQHEKTRYFNQPSPSYSKLKQDFTEESTDYF